jgi:hypothetical protein
MMVMMNHYVLNVILVYKYHNHKPYAELPFKIVLIINQATKHYVSLVIQEWNQYLLKKNVE